jgi:CBS domain-containing protein
MKVKKGQETCIISDGDTAIKKVNEILISAEKEIMVLTSSKGLIRLWRNKALLNSWKEKSVNVKIMAPVTSENLEAARELSKNVEIRHIAVCYSLMTVVDVKHLFQFKTPLLSQEKLEETTQYESTLYTNDLEYVQRTKDALNWIWKNASDLSRVVVGSIARIPVPTVTRSTPVFEIASIMAKRNIGAVIVVRDAEPLGIVTERDIIGRVVLAKTDPHEIVAQDIMTSPLITIHYDRPIEEALEIMRRNKVRRLVVVKGESMVGLLTERRLLLESIAGHTEQGVKSTAPAEANLGS